MKPLLLAACVSQSLYPSFHITAQASCGTLTKGPFSLLQRSLPNGTQLVSSKLVFEHRASSLAVPGARQANASAIVSHAAAKSKNEVSHATDTRTLIHAVLLLSLVMLLVAGSVFSNHGLLAAVVVFIYISGLIAVQFAVKQTLSSGYPYSDTLTCIHMLCTALIACCFERPSLSVALRVLPVSVANSLTLSLSNTALLYGGVAFNSMISSCTPVSAYLFEQLAGRRKHWSDGLFGTLLVCVGSMLCVNGETAASTLCFVLAGGATVCRSSKSIIQQELLLSDITPMALIFWSSVWSFLLLLPLVAISDGTQGLKALGSVNLRLTLLPIGLSIVCATSVNTTQVFAVKKLGSLLQVMLGNLNSVLVVAIAATVFNEYVLPIQWLGMAVTLVGTNITKKPAPPKKDQLANKAPEGS